MRSRSAPGARNFNRILSLYDDLDESPYLHDSDGRTKDEANTRITRGLRAVITRIFASAERHSLAAMKVTSLRGRGTRLLTDQRPKMSCTTLTVPGMDKPPSRYDVTVRVTNDDDRPPDPATFAAAVNKAASRRNASVISAHTAEEIICRSAWPRQTGPLR